MNVKSREERHANESGMGNAGLIFACPSPFGDCTFLIMRCRGSPLKRNSFYFNLHQTNFNFEVLLLGGGGCEN